MKERFGGSDTDELVLKASSDNNTEAQQTDDTGIHGIHHIVGTPSVAWIMDH